MVTVNKISRLSQTTLTVSYTYIYIIKVRLRKNYLFFVHVIFCGGIKKITQLT
jgi:hypothetical protein